LSGCPSFTNLKTARAMDKGEYEITVAGEVGGISAPSSGASQNGVVLVYPQFEVAGRWGVTDGLDLGFKVYPIGAEFDATIQLLRGGFDLALAPGVGAFGFGAFGGGDSVGYFAVPVHLDVLAGLPFGDGHEFVFGPGLYSFFALTGSSGGGSSASSTGVTLMAGGTVGVSLRAGRGLRIMPEFNIYFPFAGAVSSGSSSASSFGVSGAFVYTFALGFSFGDLGPYGAPGKTH
jgi:hypothetical protein